MRTQRTQMIPKTGRCVRLGEDNFLKFYENGELIAEFATTREQAKIYGGMREKWTSGKGSIAWLLHRVGQICEE